MQARNVLVFNSMRFQNVANIVSAHSGAYYGYFPNFMTRILPKLHILIGKIYYSMMLYTIRCYFRQIMLESDTQNINFKSEHECMI